MAALTAAAACLVIAGNAGERLTWGAAVHCMMHGGLQPCNDVRLGLCAVCHVGSVVCLVGTALTSLLAYHLLCLAKWTSRQIAYSVTCSSTLASCYSWQQRQDSRGCHTDQVAVACRPDPACVHCWMPAALHPSLQLLCHGNHLAGALHTCLLHAARREWSCVVLYAKHASYLRPRA